MTLRIETNKFYSEGGQLATWFSKEKDEFEPRVKAALEQLSSSEVGSSLLGEIKGAGHEVLIVKAAGTVGNKCAQQDKGIPACTAACYLEVLDVKLLDKKIRQLKDEGKVTDNHPGWKKYKKFYLKKAKGGQYEDYIEKLQWGGQNKEIPVEKRLSVEVPIAHKRSPHTTTDTVRERVGAGRTEPEVRDAAGYVQALQCGLIGYHIMDHLTQGAGTGAWVVWDPLMEHVCTHLEADRRAAWMDRPPWIALAHELIHGWRLVTGRCVFKPGPMEDYYEEAMTVGLPPYDQCRFTENRLRRLKGLPLRTFYAEATLNQSNRAAEKHGLAASRRKLSIKVVGSGANDPLVFDYDIRLADKPNNIITSGKTDPKGNATAQCTIDGEIRFRGLGAFGYVTTEWQKILISKYITLQANLYRFICEPIE
jgi:hypothetical protein